MGKHKGGYIEVEGRCIDYARSSRKKPVKYIQNTAKVELKLGMLYARLNMMIIRVNMMIRVNMRERPANLYGDRSAWWGELLIRMF